MKPFLSLVCISLLVIAMAADSFAFRGGGGGGRGGYGGGGGRRY